MTTETEVRSKTINGAELKYTDTGSGEPAIVFVHGWTCSRNDWRHQIEEFSGAHRVVALDLRGHGESDKPDEDYTIDGFAYDVVALISELGIERPVIVGHSMGGVVAHNIMRRRPEIALGVVLIDSNIMPPPEALEAMVASVLTGLKTDSYKNVVRTFVPAMMFNEGSDPAMRQQLVAGMLETPQRVMHTALASLFEEADRHSGDMPAPTLLLRASTLVNSTEEVKARYPNIEVQEIEGAHFLQLERPDEVNDAIRGFIKRLTEVPA